MGPLPYGPPTKHILVSTGPHCNKSQFYATEYSTNHGKEDFVPRSGKHTGTGYGSNFKPGVYYSRKLDEFDNPVLGEILSTNYQSSNKRHFEHYKWSDGRHALSEQLHMVKSGFVRDVPQTLPSCQKAQTVIYNPSSLNNRKAPKSLLHLIRHSSKDPIERENNFNGPAWLSTENRTRFPGNEQTKSIDTTKKSIGPKEGSGFTHASNVEPITYRPTECFDGTYPGWYTWRPTGRTVMKTSFCPKESNKIRDVESFSKLLSKRERHTGYTREIKSRPAHVGLESEAYTKLGDVHLLKRRTIKKNDPAEYLNMKHTKSYTSTTISTFRGLQKNENSDTKRIFTFGKQEETGFTENNCNTFIELPETSDSGERFRTSYNIRFYDKNPKTFDPGEKNTFGQLPNGFTKSTKVHFHRSEKDEKEETTSQTLHPYVMRSMASRDPYTNAQASLRANL